MAAADASDSKAAVDATSAAATGMVPVALPPPALLQRVQMDMFAWAGLHGVVVADGAAGGAAAGKIKAVPVTLFPAKFPRINYDDAKALAEPFGTLVDRISRDATWLSEKLHGTARSDEFTARLLKIHQTVTAEGVAQPYSLGILRSDYMVDEGTQRLLQVELNTISSSMAALSENVAKLHCTMLAKYLTSPESYFGKMLGAGSFQDVSARLPVNETIKPIAAGMAAAHAVYGVKEAVVCFVVLPVENNLFDQYPLEFELLDSYGIRCIRASLTEMRDRATLTPDKRLVIDGQEVAVVYYRSAYSPEHYPSEVEWDMRLLVERSVAIKCPNIAYHLAGTKKVQQELAAPGAVERFVTADEAVKLRACFAGLWNLDSAEGSVDEAKAHAVAQPAGFVLKPQREGGGNNYYGAQVKHQLESLSADELAAFILMERIFPREQPMVTIRDAKPIATLGVSELGIYSVYLGDGTSVRMNNFAGHLVRTKAAGVDEGGVAAGFAAIDSLLLV